MRFAAVPATKEALPFCDGLDVTCWPHLPRVSFAMTDKQLQKLRFELINFLLSLFLQLLSNPK